MGDGIDALVGGPTLSCGASVGPVLGIDTSAGAAVGIVVPGRDPVRRIAEDPRRQVEDLAPLIADVLGEVGLTPRDLAAVAVGTGPATFTGLRIGLATARTLAFAVGVPVWGVCSLDVLAAQALADLKIPPGSRILATGDARRREVFWAAYTVDGDPPVLTRSHPPAVAAPATVAEHLVTGAIVGREPSGLASAGDAVEVTIGDGTGGLVSGVAIVGGGAVAYPESLPLSPGAPTRPDPVVLALVAAARAAEGADTSTAPLYLRRPDANPPGARKRATAAP
ncbi:MAG: tRNA (adenosine(37)-N6)-threonylcarbamoyltransferase complex dimerization subunit type 1 TsaB [Micrococcales bacterium]|nr:tRNA (adenosine(37)-N6)-threonylcarbamoyltransferase complex dimerization subunit type 1 TsaB [Micrococcales bacterium]